MQRDSDDYGRARQPMRAPNGRRVYETESAQHRGARPPTGSRSRFLATVVLIATALVILVTGLAVSAGDKSTDARQSIPIELLPFPPSTATLTTQ